MGLGVGQGEMSRAGLKTGLGKSAYAGPLPLTSRTRVHGNGLEALSDV